MKTIKKLSILIIIFCILSCSSNDSSNEDETKATVKDIYVCGLEQRSSTGKYIATVWKNGVASSLTDGTNDAIANDITVSGNDVYVVGYEENVNGAQVARLWKNGVQVDFVNTPRSAADFVEVSGNEVYIIGLLYENNSNVQKIWKNGIASTLQGDTRSMAVNNNDVYTVGIQDGNARVWTNGAVSSLTNGYSSSGAYDVEIKNNDVYIVGAEKIGNASVARLWKNGVASNLSDGKISTTALNISITGKDVYVSGYESTSSQFNSKVWKNGEVIWYKENFKMNDLQAVGQDFYLLTNLGGAKIVKNGFSEDLSSAYNSYAYALFITTN